MVEAAPEAMLVADPLGMIRYSNARFSRMFGYAAEDIVGHSVSLLLAPSDGGAAQADADRPSASRLEEFLAENAHHEGRRRDGTHFPISVSSSPVELNVGAAVLCVVRDVTEERQALAVLKYVGEQLRERNTELEQFTYHASHDLKEPLRSISAFVELLRETLDGSPDETTVDALHFIGDGVQRMTELVQDLLEYSRSGQVGDFERVNLNECVNEALANLRARIEATDAQIEVAPLPQLTARRLDMRQLFQNLIGNAMKFQPQGRRPQIRVAAQACGEQWRIRVEDNGIGIPDGQAQSIFKPFVRLHDRRDFEGTGIGLAHCQKIVERHEGRIWAEAATEQGAVLLVELPGESDELF